MQLSKLLTITLAVLLGLAGVLSIVGVAVGVKGAVDVVDDVTGGDELEYVDMTRSHSTWGGDDLVEDMHDNLSSFVSSSLLGHGPSSLFGRHSSALLADSGDAEVDEFVLTLFVKGEEQAEVTPEEYRNLHLDEIEVLDKGNMFAEFFDKTILAAVSVIVLVSVLLSTTALCCRTTCVRVFVIIWNTLMFILLIVLAVMFVGKCPWDMMIFKDFIADEIDSMAQNFVRDADWRINSYNSGRAESEQLHLTCDAMTCGDKFAEHMEVSRSSALDPFAVLFILLSAGIAGVTFLVCFAVRREKNVKNEEE